MGPWLPPKRGRAQENVPRPPLRDRAGKIKSCQDTCCLAVGRAGPEIWMPDEATPRQAPGPTVGRRECPSGRPARAAATRPIHAVHAVAGREVAARRRPTRCRCLRVVGSRAPLWRHPPPLLAALQRCRAGRLRRVRRQCRPLEHDAPPTHTRQAGLRKEDTAEPWAATWRVVCRALYTRGSLWRSLRWLSPWRVPSIAEAPSSSAARPAPSAHAGTVHGPLFFFRVGTESPPAGGQV